MPELIVIRLSVVQFREYSGEKFKHGQGRFEPNSKSAYLMTLIVCLEV